MLFLSACTCVEKCEESLAEVLVLLTEDCPSATPVPTQEQLPDTFWLFCPLCGGDLNCCRAGLKGNMNRALRLLLLHLLFFFPELQPISSWIQEVPCLYCCLSLSVLKGCELWADLAVLKVCHSTVFIAPTVRWALFLWTFFLDKLSVSCTWVEVSRPLYLSWRHVFWHLENQAPNASDSNPTWLLRWLSHSDNLIMEDVAWKL